MMRFVIASRYDSGSGFLYSYFVILNEMYHNSCPKRYMKLCMQRCMRYHLGREDNSKRIWLNLLSSHIYMIRLGIAHYDRFIDELYKCIGPKMKGHMCFKDDMSDDFAYPQIGRRLFHQAGE